MDIDKALLLINDKKTTVEGYDPNIFEPTLGGKNRIKKQKTKNRRKLNISKKTRYSKKKK